MYDYNYNGIYYITRIEHVAYFVVRDMNLYMMKWSSNLSSYSLDTNFSSSCIGKITAQEHSYNSQHETLLADLNRYTAAMHLVIILTDDAIKHTHIWPLTRRDKSRTIHSLLFSIFSPFHSPVKGKGKQWRMKGLTMAQWIYLNWHNRSVLAHWYSVLSEKTGLILLLLVGLTTGRQTKYRWISKFLNSLEVRLFRL